MRIGCLQFAPQVGDTENNLNRADAVLSKANPEELDLLVLPEMAFSGYNFKSLQDITPFLEPSGSGITSLWARTMALKYNTIVTVGYPEKVDVSPKWPTGPEYYNSAIVVNEDGETIANYRKAFLYYTDQTWALEGNKGFFEGVIPGLGNTSLGICMDINPYKFEAPWHAFEFAFHVLEVQSNLVILSMAWLTREEPRQFSRMPNEPDMETLTYWVTRLEPLIRSDNQDEIIVVFCNRTGSEDEAIYAGTSAVVGIQEGEVKVYGLLGRGEKELLVVDTNKAPYAKLIYCPPDNDVAPESAKLQKSQKPNGTSGAAPPGAKPTGHDSSQGQTGTPNGSKPEEGQRGSPGCKSVASASESGRSTSTPVDGKKSSAQVEPKVNGDTGTPKKRAAAPIQLPPTKEASDKNGAAMSPGSENFNGIPTPSAPSPTPMAIRPRLIIPESPPIQPHQYPPDHPMSAASLNSEKSMGSFKSDESEASVVTVKSNPRPPEESTPFPHSGAPPSGYPDNAWSDDSKRIYGGNVRITQFDEFSPTTPFQDISPASPRFFWRPPDSLLRTPSSAVTAGWTPGTPIGRKSEPFPWSEITGAAHKPKKAEEPIKVPKSAVEDLRNGCHSPQSNASSNRTAKSAKSARSSSTTGRSTSTAGRSSSTTSRSKKSSKEEKGEYRPGRPFSPKSRNASRSRNNERSNSSLSEREVAAAVAMHLDGISQRAESATSMRKESKSGTPIPDRPESPKSRNRSRNRDNVVERELTTGPQTIPIAASPSLLRHPASTPEARNFYQQAPMVAAGLHHRANSLLNGNGRFSPSQNVTPTGSNIPRPASRTASRGRQPGPQGATDSMSVRSTSQDSTRNDRLHTRVSRRRESNGRSATGSTHSGRRSSNQNEDLSQYQRVEQIVCPSCPVHGAPSESRSASEASTSDAGSRRQSSDSQTASREETSGSIRLETSTTESSVNAGEGAAASDYGSSNDTSFPASSSERSPSTPSLFDPPTPRAMSFGADEYTLDSAVTLDTPTPTDAAGKSFPDREIPKSAEIPTPAA